MQDQLGEALSSMTSEDAIRAIKSHGSWRKFQESFEVSGRKVGFQVSNHERYRIVAAILEGGGIPSGIGSLWMNSRKESFQDVLLISMITTENCFDLTAKFLLVDPAVVFGGGDRAARWIASRW